MLFSKIQHLSESDEILATYSDCVVFKTMSRDYESEDDNAYVIKFNTDVTLGALKASQQKMNTLETEIKALKYENSSLRELFDTLIVTALEV